MKISSYKQYMRSLSHSEENSKIELFFSIVRSLFHITKVNEKKFNLNPKEKGCYIPSIHFRFLFITNIHPFLYKQILIYLEKHSKKTSRTNINEIKELTA